MDVYAQESLKILSELKFFRIFLLKRIFENCEFVSDIVRG